MALVQKEKKIQGRVEQFLKTVDISKELQGDLRDMVQNMVSHDAFGNPE